MKYKILIVLIAFIFLGIGCALGFKVGSEKMWANASVYYASPTIYALEKKNYGHPLDLTRESCKDQYSKQISSAVTSYSRYLNRWESKLASVVVWDLSTKRMGEALITYYIQNAEVNYAEISGSEYWKTLQNRNISFYEDMKISDPELYSQLESETITDLNNLKNAIKYHKLMDEQ